MNKVVLYVDDEPWFINSLYDALVDAGYMLLKAYNGTEAIEILKQSVVSNTTPDLIVLDVIMPTGEGEAEDILDSNDGGRRTGIKIYEIIRTHLKLTTPIVFVTVVDDPMVERNIEQSEKSLGIKTINFLVKPVLPTELLDVVDRILKSSKTIGEA